MIWERGRGLVERDEGREETPSLDRGSGWVELEVEGGSTREKMERVLGVEEEEEDCRLKLVREALRGKEACEAAAAAEASGGGELEGERDKEVLEGGTTRVGMDECENTEASWPASSCARCERGFGEGDVAREDAAGMAGVDESEPTSEGEGREEGFGAVTAAEGGGLAAAVAEEAEV